MQIGGKRVEGTHARKGRKTERNLWSKNTEAKRGTEVEGDTERGRNSIALPHKGGKKFMYRNLGGSSYPLLCRVKLTPPRKGGVGIGYNESGVKKRGVATAYWVS